MSVFQEIGEYFRRGKRGGKGLLRQYQVAGYEAESALTETPVLVRTRPDPLFLILSVILLLVGTVMSFSASSAYAETQYGNSFFFLTQHIKHMAVALVPTLGMILFLTPSRARWCAVGIYAGALVLLLLVLAIGVTGGGAQRWIDLGIVQFQPSEAAKTGIIMLMALYMSRHEDDINTHGLNRRSFKHGFLVPGIIFGTVCLLVGLEKHFSGVIIIGAIGIAMMFIGGTNLLWFASVVPVAGLLFYIIMQTEYARSRIESWMNRGADTLGNDWQSTQGLYAIGSGGLFGLGIGESRLKYGYVSQPQNDFVFTVVCEELGFFGALAILLLFLALAGRGFVLASRAPDKFCSLVIFGLSFKLALQVLLNVGVVTGLLPNTGIALPFFSSGGTATLMQMTEIGIILGLSRFCTQKQ